MMTKRKKQRLWTLAKLVAIVLVATLILTPRDIDLSAISRFNPLVTQVQAAGF